MIQASSMDLPMGETLQTVWGKQPIINENFGSVKMTTKQQPQHHILPQQQQPIMQQQPVMQQPVYTMPQQVEHFSQNNSNKYFGKENPDNVAVAVSGFLFVFLSWIAICVLMYKTCHIENGSNVVLGVGVFVYFCVGVSVLVSVIYKIASKSY